MWWGEAGTRPILIRSKNGRGVHLARFVLLNCQLVRQHGNGAGQHEAQHLLDGDSMAALFVRNEEFAITFPRAAVKFNGMHGMRAADVDVNLLKLKPIKFLRVLNSLFDLRWQA
jgi:hypothetical protein